MQHRQQAWVLNGRHQCWLLGPFRHNGNYDCPTPASQSQPLCILTSSSAEKKNPCCRVFFMLTSCPHKYRSIRISMSSAYGFQTHENGRSLRGGW